MNEEIVRLREEITIQINALKSTCQKWQNLTVLTFKPTTNTKEAIQWLYFAYLATTKRPKQCCNVYW